MITHEVDCTSDTEKIEKIRKRIAIMGLKKDLSIKSNDIFEAMADLTINEIAEEIGDLLWCIRDIRDIVGEYNECGCSSVG